MTKKILLAYGVRPMASRRIRPLLAAALSLLALGTSWGQQRLMPNATVATRESIAAGLPAGATSAAKPFVPSPAATYRVQAAIASTATGGNWSAASTWVGGVVPTATDDVTIASGATVTLDVAAAAGSLTIASGGTLVTSATTAYSLQVGGNVTNNGTLTMSASSTIGSDLRFVGAGSVTFGGTGTTDLYTMTLAKSTLADVVEMSLPTLSVKGTAAATTGFLLTQTTAATPVNDMTGTLKISGTATLTNRVFGNAASYVIPATGAFWLNNANFTVSAQTGSPSVSGQLRITAGTFNVGTSIGNSLSFGSGSVYTQEGGSLNVAGRFGSFTSATAAAAMTFNLSAGALNVSTIGNTSGTPSFGVNGTTTISGGVVNLVQRSTATTPLDYYVAGTYNFTGGAVNVGVAATATNFDFRIRGTFPNLTIDNTTNAKSALLQGQTNVYGTTLTTPGSNLNLNGQLLLQLGSTITNNGTVTGTTASSTLYFGGSVAQTLGGSGTFTTLRTLSVDNAGSGITLTVPLVVTRVNMFTGNLNGAGNLTIGDASATFFVVQIGVSATATSGAITSAPVFNIGSGALQLIYAPELTARTTGFEIPATRIVDIVTISNAAGVILAGGNLTINSSGVSNGSLILTTGLFTTSAANIATIGTAAGTYPTGSATSYVKGPLGITVNSATAVSRTFGVGDAAGWRPVVVNGITTSSAQTFTATVVNGAANGSVSGGISSLNPTRYVRLQNSANLPATATVQLSYGADDVVGSPATAVVAQAATANGVYASLGGAAATAPTTGIVSTQGITPGNDFFVLANTEGGALATSVASGCAGSTSGTLTLSGNAAGSTIVKYQADSGSGFADVAGTNTGTTLAFTNLTATTTFRAVILTSDNRTVYSAPVTVTVTPLASSAFSYSGSPFCKSSTATPTPTITGTAGGVFSSTTGLSLNASTGAISLSASTAGTYVVTYTVSGTCGSSSTQSVTITAAPLANIGYGASSYCTTTTGTVALGLGTGSTLGTLTVNPATGLTIAANGTLTPSTSTPGTYFITNTVAASGGCAAVTGGTTVTITAPPVAAFSYSGSPFCASATTNPTVTLGTGATAGTFTASPAGLTLNAATGAITLSSSTPGTYTVTNTVAASGGCAAVTATASVTITAAPVAAFSYSGSPFCKSSTTNPAVTLGTGASAGTFTATPAGLTINATTGAITLSSSTAGTYTVTNTVAAAGGCAATTATTTITITAAPLANIGYGASSYCTGTSGTVALGLGTGSTLGTLTVNPATGLSIAANGTLTPSTSTPGTYFITNTVAASGGCAAVTGGTTVTINATPATPTLTVTGTPSTGLVLTSSAATGNQFYLNGVAIAGATGQTYVVNSGTRNGSYTVVVTSTGGCASASSAPVSVTVTASTAAQVATSLAVYPNPTPDGHLSVELSGYREAVQLTISNALGQRVYEASVAASAAHKQAIDLSALPGGVYVLQARTASGGVEVRRIVRE
ncbi:T9SS type A sorting domain-containing protein [Hymenobacter baengnokdamensis]|uniref:T9SS type A sorting domain-containing protein n=1 Tax=Hymenobacter baengnokdamensis TaxID=2615203 RepID=UPI0017861C11|nr:T9SS type A sorting domain-containing protein [Hymenobacter baengnokdamensis]